MIVTTQRAQQIAHCIRQRPEYRFTDKAHYSTVQTFFLDGDYNDSIEFKFKGDKCIITTNTDHAEEVLSLCL